MHCDWGELSSILTLNQQVLALGSLIGSYYAMFFSLLVFRHPKAKTHIIPISAVLLSEATSGRLLMLQHHLRGEHEKYQIGSDGQEPSGPREAYRKSPVGVHG